MPTTDFESLIELNRRQQQQQQSDSKISSPMSSANSVHHHQEQKTNSNETMKFNAVLADVNDENEASSSALDSVVNGSKKVSNEASNELSLVSSIAPSSPTSHHVPSTPPLQLSKMDIDDQSSELTLSTHKSIHQTAANCRNMMHDENLENKQQNFVNDDDDVWRQW